MKCNVVLELKKELRKNNIDTLIITDLSNIFYLSGFTGSVAILIINKDNSKPQFISDSRYDLQAHKEISNNIEINISNNIFLCLIELIKKKKNIKHLAVISEYTELKFFYFLKEKLAKLKIKGVKDYLLTQKIKKDKKEIELIKKAIKITEQSILKTIKNIKSGITEKNIAINIEYEMKMQGAEKPCFDTIIASGKNSAMPHARASLKKIKKNEAIIIDCGCSYKGYCSDLTRTFFLDKISDKFKKMYEQLLFAQKQVIKDIKPGIRAKDLDLKARAILKEFNLDKYFIHSLGHGIGIKVHEFPNISQNSDFIIEKDMVFTIEPGIYIPNVCGMRIEDVVLVTDKGYNVLTNLGKEVNNILL